MEKDLHSLKKTELLKIAKEQKIKNANFFKKEELVNLLTRFFKSNTPAAKTIPVKDTKRTSLSATAPSALKVKQSGKTLDELKLLYKRNQTTSGVREERKEPSTAALQETQSIRYGTNDLPNTYNETRLVAIVRDPYWAYTYWDVSDETNRYVQSLYTDYEAIRPVLRIYDVTGVSFNGKNGKRSWDLDVTLEAKNWYVNLGSPGCAFVIDLGLKDKTGKFFLLARSNRISLPIDYPSHIVDDKWMITDEDFDELYAISGGVGIGLSSGEIKQRKKKLFKFQELLSSGALSSPGITAEKAKGRDFFLEVATELILYGRTYADATLTVDNKKVKLRPDGTFTLRYFLPDGTLPLPVKAVSSDGEETREVKISVNKETT